MEELRPEEPVVLPQVMREQAVQGEQDFSLVPVAQEEIPHL